MKTNIFIIILSGILLCACDNKEENIKFGEAPPRHWIENGSYIQGYSYGDPKLVSFSGDRDDKDNVGFYVTADKLCMSPDYCNFFSHREPQQSQEDTKRFLATAEANADIHYTGWIYELHMALAEHIREIHLSCNRDWDASHPAGSSLDDVFAISGMTYKRFLESGYTQDGRLAWLYQKINTFTADDLYIIQDNFTISAHPERCQLFGKEVTFFLKVVLSDGREVDSQYTVRPDEWNGTIIHR